MRIDKYLKISRIIKRRSVAKEACDMGRVTINGRTAKAGSEVEPGDEVHIEFGNSSITFKIVSTPEVIRKEDVSSMYEIIEG
jgi:ribosomal 50S subunit-recycling heat shock protein